MAHILEYICLLILGVSLVFFNRAYQQHKASKQFVIRFPRGEK